MDQHERELLVQDMGTWFDSLFADQTKHLIEAMPCTCKKDVDFTTHPDTEGVIQVKVTKLLECNRCKKLKELE